MEENGWLLLSNRTRIYQKVLYPGTVRTGLQKRIGWLYQTITPLSPTALSFWVVAIVVVLLGQLHPAGSSPSPTLCPDQCICSNWNVTTLQMPVLDMDCSSGNAYSFVVFTSGHGKTSDNVTLTNNQLPLLNNQSREYPLPSLILANKTNDIITQHEGNKTEQGSMHDHLDTEAGVNTSLHKEDPLLINLHLSFNNITSLQYLGFLDWKATPAVTQLNLSNNHIENLENPFGSFTNLVNLDLSNNFIRVFSLKVFQHLSSLEYLHLQNNKITTVIHEPDNRLLSNLVHLDLSHNRLLSLPAETFVDLPMLSSLNLSHNNIANINHFAFAKLQQLQLLSLSHNNITSLDYPVFENTSLVSLSLANMPQLSRLRHDVFQGLTHLQYLNLSHNTRLNFLHQTILFDLKSLQILDLSESAITKLSSLTFQNNLQLRAVYLKHIPLTCQCTNAWLVSHLHQNNSIFPNATSLECTNLHDNLTVPLADAVFPCQAISIPSVRNELSVAIGSTLTLQCKQAYSSSEDILTWTTPSGHKFYYHSFHTNSTHHLLSPKDVQPKATFHKKHYWHHSSAYYSDLSSYNDRILLLSDGSLFIDYVLRTDAGSYSCVVKNAHFNDSESIVVQFSYKISHEIKIVAFIVGFLCALGIFTLNVVYVVISWLARRLVNKRRRETIRQMLENLNIYKSTHIARIYENYTCQLNRVRNRYHVQRDRLQKNYTMQVDRVKRGCSHQVEKVRDNYNSKLNHLREYSSSQIMQIREMTNNQIGRIRDYGSSQLDRLRETYKLQHQHMMKLLDTMNLDNCRSIVETECMRTESMMYDLDLLSQEDVRTESPFSLADSEYNTANSSPLLSVGSNEPIGLSYQIKENASGDQNRLVDEDKYLDIIAGITEANLIDAERNEAEQVLRVTRGESNAITEDCMSESTDDIEIEMNTILALPDNTHLKAKEVWTYGKGDDSSHKLYTKIHSPRASHSDFGERSEPQTLVNVEPLHKGRTTTTKADIKTVPSVSLPSIEMDVIQPAMMQSDIGAAYAEREASPVNVWLGEPL